MTQEQIKAKILILTGITEEVYSTEIWESGIAFAEHYTHQDEWGVSAITKTNAYWAWWKNQFSLLDEIFLAGYSSFFSGRPQLHIFLMEYWKAEHAPNNVCSYPNLHDEYSHMLEQAVIEDVNIQSFSSANKNN